MATFCSNKGLYLEQLVQWGKPCAGANQLAPCAQRRNDQDEVRTDTKRNKELEDNWSRKDKAMSETAALLAARKGPMRFGNWRGRMISTPDRVNAIELIDEAVLNAAKRTPACEEIEISDRTYRRWTEDELMPGQQPYIKNPQTS